MDNQKSVNSAPIISPESSPTTLPETTFNSLNKNHETPTNTENLSETFAETTDLSRELPPMPPIVSTTTAPPLADTGTIEEQNPEIAADGHKLEKQWVQRTEEVIEKTKGDPREKENQVNRLKADYLLKRFNRRLGDRN